MKNIIRILSILLLVSACSNNSSPLEPKAMTKVPASAVQSKLLIKMDSVRALSQLDTVEQIDIISNQCYQHSLYMLEMGELSHDNFKEDRMAVIKTELAYDLAYENVGFYYGTDDPSENIFKDWMNDTDIKSNILKSWDKMGMAVVTDSLGNYYTTQIFITLR